MVRRLAKYQKVIRQWFSQKRALRQLREYGNQTVTAIADVIHKVKTQNYSSKEKEIFAALEEYRNTLKKDRREISYQIFGSERTREVGEICNKAASPKTWCEFHYVLADILKAKSYLEMGTNLGVSGSYLISALKQHNGKLITMEGHPDFCAISQDQFSKLTDANGFEIIQGFYDQTFPQLMQRPEIFDMVFIDGNHRKQPTLEYFQSLKKKLTKPGVMIFDDINWSDEMREAWAIIQKDPDVNYAIDFFKLGIVVIDKADTRKNELLDVFLAF